MSPRARLALAVDTALTVVIACIVVVVLAKRCQ